MLQASDRRLNIEHLKITRLERRRMRLVQVGGFFFFFFPFFFRISSY